LTLLATLAGLLSAPVHQATAQTAWYEGFEGPDPSWKELGGNAAYQVDGHQRVRGVAYTGEGCEWIRVTGSGGSQIYFGHDVGRARVIDELLPTLRVRSDRAGLQVLARVVLPRTEDPRTGRPVTTLIRGTSYSTVGGWEQLRVEGIPKALARQARVLRLQMRQDVDEREAYVDAILLNVYGGPGTTNVWIDDLDIAGYVAVEAATAMAGDTPPPQVRAVHSIPAPPMGSSIGAGGPAVGRIANPSYPSPGASPGPSPGTDGPLVGRIANPSSASSGPSSQGRIRLDNSVLLVENRPLFVRMLQYQGEPLTLIKQLGFNAVWLPQLPTMEFIDEARRQALWIVCPPPRPPASDAAGRFDPLPPIGPAYAPVLAWDLGAGLESEQLAFTRQWAEMVRDADRTVARPLLCRPQSNLWDYSRQVDLLLLGRAPLGTSLDLADYGVWLRQRPRLARPGTPFWATVQTQPAPSLVRQWKAVGRGEPYPLTMSSEQIRLLTYTAATSGAHGLFFESLTTLNSNDPDTRQRAMTLELLNHELALVEPWMAAGKFVDSLRGSDSQTTAGVLETERTRLLLPLWISPGAQFVAGQSAGNTVAFVVPGGPDTYRTYLLTPGNLEPLRRDRVTGGTRVILNEFSLTALVPMTDDDLAVHALTPQVPQAAPRVAELERRLTGERFDQVRQIAGRLQGDLRPPQTAYWLAAAEKSLQSCDAFLATHDYARACLDAQRAMRPVRMLERAAWQKAVEKLSSPVSSPATVTFRTLPWQAELLAIANSGGVNQLAGGDFEDMGVMEGAGWRRFQNPATDVFCDVRLTPAAAHGGRLGVLLVAQPAHAETPDLLLETPPVWFTSPAVPVEAGTLVRIHAWVRVSKPITGSVDGLLVVDSLGGEPLAERIVTTHASWREINLYRVAPESGAVSVTFALTGLGEVSLDDVSIHTVRPWNHSPPSPGPAVSQLRHLPPVGIWR
jgi:hypothetical protein